MKWILLPIVAVIITQCAPNEPFDFSRTLRLDYTHTGGPLPEALGFGRVVSDGPWAGSRTQLVAETDLGSYRFEVVDRGPHRLLYSRGFGSIYSEWLTIPQAKIEPRTFHESVRFPWPREAVTVVFEKRDVQGTFQRLWSVDIDPARESSEDPAPSVAIETLVDNGPAASKVDVLLLGDDYDANEQRKFQADAKRLLGALFAQEPFTSRRTSFNVRAVNLPGRHFGVERNVFGIPRYMLGADNRAVREIARVAPYDVIAILADDNQYGGGGIFNLQSTVAARAAASEYIFVHEFAHNLAGLGDEYVGNVTYEFASVTQVEPWEPNLTALLEPARLKWRDLVEAGTPLPTPLSFAGKVGAFEGGGYRARGIYRPEADCIMHSSNPVGFCRVCRRAIERAIDTYAR